MRSLLVMAMFASSLTYAAWNGYTETRDLELNANGIELLEIDAGAGGMVVRGAESGDQIEVRALIKVTADEDDAIEMIARDMVLKLEERRGKAMLDAYFEQSSWSHRDSPMIDLEVTVPAGLDLFIDDGSGSIDINDMASDVRIDDGSGSIVITSANSVVIDDGSGSIKVLNVAGDVEVEDGSGDLQVRSVGGMVTIDDGSGGIDVSDVERDLEIVDAGSGSVRIADVRGAVRRDD